MPGLGAHRLDRLEPEHPERCYRKVQDFGSSAGTAHHVHRTIRVALGKRCAADASPTAAGADWEGKGHVFASPAGGPLSPNPTS